MLNMAFGQSKYYVDSLSENTKRGLRQKVRNGDYPTLAPVGYINDSRTKTVVVDRKKAKVIKQAFEFYVKGGNRLEDVSNFLAKHNLFSKTGKKIHKSRATSILSNPFYTGLFRYGGELHEGKYEPIISKKLFDQAQEMLKFRGKPDRKPLNDPQPFCGLISCASCGMMITGEYKVKKQKNGNVHEYVYYHCTKKNKKRFLLSQSDWSDFLTAILTKILKRKYIVLKKENYFCKRSRSRKKSTIFHTSRMIGSNLSKTG